MLYILYSSSAANSASRNGKCDIEEGRLFYFKVTQKRQKKISRSRFKFKP